MWQEWEIIQPGSPVHQWRDHEDDWQQAASWQEVHQSKATFWVHQIEEWKLNLIFFTTLCSNSEALYMSFNVTQIVLQWLFGHV